MSSPRTVAFHTLGCKLNFSETSTLARSLEEAGYARVRVEERPDVFVLNTCSVTENADKECRRHVRRFQAINPDAFIAVVGCYAQLKPEEIAAIPGVGLVLGANEKFDLAAHIEACSSGLEPESQELGEEELVGLRQELGEEELVRGREEVGNEGLVRLRLKAGVTTPGGVVKAGAIKEVKRFIPSYNANDPASGDASAGARTRTFLKVQDGCDYFCSFCTIPLARGRSRSGTIAETVEQARQIARTGVQEIVLTGVNTGDFGKSSALRGSTTLAGTEDFHQLIQALDQVQGIARFRISSIEPNLCHDGIIDFVASSQRFTPHFHMPLQSGSDVILQRMRRRYDTALYAERVQRIKQRMPHACIGVDVITGTPGETEEEFLKTHEFLRSIPVDYLHVFTYSERANTTAVRLPAGKAGMDDSVPMAVRRERTRQLRILSNKLQRDFYHRHLGSTRPVLFEHGERPEHGTSDRIEGYTDNYLRVSLPYDPSLANTIVPVILERINGDGHATGMVRTLEPLDVDPVGRRYRWPVATSPIAN
jgi:threonylcarbamoyladenosine tRNA methylthiotransferase MtaB